MWSQLKNKLGKIHRDDAGAMSVEKILILAFISLPLLLLIWHFRPVLTNMFNSQSVDFQNDTGTTN